MTVAASTTTLMDSALLYASDGVRVFPVRANKKLPLIKQWPVAASCDAEQVRRWWTQWPDAMIGAATGAASGFWALDLDTKPGKNGIANLAKLEAENGKLPATYRCRTPSGGEHRYFSYPRGVRIASRAGDIAPGVDTRGGRADGASAGFVVLPPSLAVDGRCYQPLDSSDVLWNIGLDLPHAPDWLLYLAMFSRRQRENLASAGIKGPRDFGGAAPVSWSGLADEALSKAYRGADHRRPLDTQAADKLTRYVASAIDSEISKIAAAEIGEQEKTINNGGLAIHSLIAGARLCGISPDALGQIEAQARERYCEAVVGLPDGRANEPWMAHDAIEKWQHTADDAEPRNLWHVCGTSADADFAGVDMRELGTGKSVLEFPSEISLEAIAQRQADALVKGLLHPSETAMLYGASGAGKSFIALDAAWHVATGQDWHGRRVTQSAVLYVCLEGIDGFRKRMLAYRDACGDPKGSFARYKPHISLVKADTGKKGADAVVSAARQLAEDSALPTRLIVIDTLARAMAGDDENATGDMTAFVERRAGYIARQTGAAVLIVHHTNATGTVRGNGSLWAGCDTVFRAHRDGDRRTLIAEKVKDGAEGPLFGYTLDPVDLGTDADGEPITTCIVRSQPVEETTTKTKSRKQAKHSRIFSEAFDAAIGQRNEVIDAPAPMDGCIVSKVTLSAVRSEFFDRYASEPGAPSADRLWRLARSEAVASQYEFETVDGVERVWRLADIYPDPSGA